MTVWSGFITPGEPVYVAPNSVGFCVRSYPAAAHPVGVAIGVDAVMVAPGAFARIPEMVTTVLSGGIMLGANSAWLHPSASVRHHF
jgi:hypothetical protein